ncbi:Acyl carrier protein [Hibiscus syriacus]|uniref:Acyl carrier protein n=1 Tax=Hibiscus syriacus TaxID=106335 RepID=A0A6A2ZC61_HIBSY|nr:Acyl carrier protein [Hibiscus syriacus]
MAVFASIPACSLASPATISLAKGSYSQHKSFSTTGGPVVCNGLKLIPKIQFSKQTNKLSTRSSCFKIPVSCSLADPETLKTVQNTIAKQLSIDVSSVTPETKFADLGADSLDTVFSSLQDESHICFLHYNPFFISSLHQIHFRWR